MRKTSSEKKNSLCADYTAVARGADGTVDMLKLIEIVNDKLASLAQPLNIPMKWLV